MKVHFVPRHARKEKAENNQNRDFELKAKSMQKK